MITVDENRKLQYLINQAYVRKEFCHTKRTQDIYYYLNSKCLAHVTHVYKYNKVLESFVHFPAD